MASVARCRLVVAHRGATHALPPAQRVAATVGEDRQRAATAVLDQLRFGVVALVRQVAERLTTRPASVQFGALELEVRDTVLAVGRDLLTELARLRGTGYRGHSYVCPCGVRVVLKELAPLQQRTWFGCWPRMG